jgi:N-acylneuraminate cytidylyltransferase
MAMTVPVLIEVLEKYAKLGKTFTNLCCLYPCAPFVTPERLREAMKLLQTSEADSIFPIVKFSYPPQRCLVVRDGKVAMLNPENYNVRSQDLEPLYHDAGQFYCCKVDAFLNQGKLMLENTKPIILSELEVQDIDSAEDWKIAEIKYLYNKKQGDK